MSVAPSWLALKLLEGGLLPDWVIRSGIRRIVRSRLREERTRATLDTSNVALFADARRTGPIAVATADANAQHYEVPTEFYELVLGRHLKYSSAWWDADTATLDDAEARMLQIYTERAELTDGQTVLELGCGWGSFSLWMARRYPASEIVGVSNSASQKRWIDRQAARDGLKNLRVITADMNQFDAARRFDRIVSIEMFEHMRNWGALLSNVRRWLEDDGRAFIHIFTHHSYAYPYDVRDRSDWMAEYFFTGGIMPSDRLLYEFSDLVSVLGHWQVSGVHYQKTAEAWLANMDSNRARIWPILEHLYAPGEARRWWVRWRVFFMACAELWGYNEGKEWGVSHYLLKKS